ncbi:MAG: polymer-forming cytoskeletal protein [Candidatus Doudnabacteria bacterium]|nr:polymer-forming cytoskeletal protein [Candidatus Doudnabacteria bacterium]
MARNDIPETIVSAGMRIEGELKSNGNIRIDGIVSGKVQTSQDLVLGATAQIDADLIAANAFISGTVKGNVTVKNSLSITETGRILGNIVCARISIHEGGVFNGNCIMREIKPSEAPKVESRNLEAGI